MIDIQKEAEALAEELKHYFGAPSWRRSHANLIHALCARIRAEAAPPAAPEPRAVTDEDVAAAIREYLNATGCVFGNAMRRALEAAAKVRAGGKP